MKSHRSTLLQPSTLMRGHLTSSESFSKRVRNVRNGQGHDLNRMSNVRIAMIKGWDGGLASPRVAFAKRERRQRPGLSGSRFGPYRSDRLLRRRKASD
ncbi:hypothetical protein SLA2020_357580 [Shorea laevis]